MKILERIAREIDTHAPIYIHTKATIGASLCVKKWLKQKKLDQAWLANKYGVSEPRMSRILSGLDLWTVDTFLRFQRITGLDLISFPTTEKIKGHFTVKVLNRPTVVQEVSEAVYHEDDQTVEGTVSLNI